MDRKKKGFLRALLILCLFLMAGTVYAGNGASLKFNKAARTLKVGTVKTIKATAKGIKKVKYSSSNRKVAEVDAATGKVTVKKEGTAKITAKGGGKSASYTIKAMPVVKLNVSSVKLDVNATRKLKAAVKGTSAKKKWSSSNPSVASVSSSGKIKAKKAGTATITVSVKGKHGKVSAKCKVTVRGPKITLNKTSLTLSKKQTETLTAKVKNSSENVKWKTSNSKVVSISKKKNQVTLTAKKAGTATITAYIGKVKAVCKVTVQEADWKGLYYDFLKKGETSFSYKAGGYTSTAKARSFYLVHLNDDTVPELVVSSLSSNPGGPENFWVFTVKNGKVTYAGNVSQKGRSNLCYNKKYKAISSGWWTNGVGGAGEALWKVKNGKLIQYKYAYDYNEGNKRIYKTGNTLESAKKVSRSAAQSFSKKYFNVKDQKNRTRLQNTESVRAKQFK